MSQQDGQSEPRALLEGRVVGILNLGSGRSDAKSPGQMQEIFIAAGLPRAEVVGVTPEELDRALNDAVARADVVVILGGDGTIRSAATKCGAAGKPMIPLPGGTMNMLPRGLYGERGWEEALGDTLADPALHQVSGAKAGEEVFFCAAVLGAPSLWADAREALRHGDLGAAATSAVTAIRRSGGAPLTYRFDSGSESTAEAIGVICPLVSKRMAEDAPRLEAAAVDAQTAASLFRLAFNAVFEDWRADASVHLARVQQVQVTGHGRVPVILDGEKARFGRSVTISFMPHAFTAIVPAGEAIGTVAAL